MKRATCEWTADDGKTYRGGTHASDVPLERLPFFRRTQQQQQQKER